MGIILSATRLGMFTSYAEFCNLYTPWQVSLRLLMRQTHCAGEKLFGDYCGQTFPIINTATDEVCEAKVLVAVFGASNYTFAEARRTQKLEDWIGSHSRAFFEVASQLVVPDNLKSGVTNGLPLRPSFEPIYA